MQAFKSVDLDPYFAERTLGAQDTWRFLCRSAATARRAGRRKSTITKQLMRMAPDPSNAQVQAWVESAVERVYALGDCPVCED